MKCPWKANTIWRRCTIDYHVIFLYPRDWCLTPPDKKPQIYQTLIKTLKPIKRILFSSWKLKRSLSKLRPKTVAPGMALAPGGKSQKNNKAQWVPRLFLDVPFLLQYITCPIQSPTTEFWMALTRIFHRPKKQWFATSENESFTNQRLSGLI